MLTGFRILSTRALDAPKPAMSTDKHEPAPSVHLDFLVPGFSKCGTTTLASLLTQHPDLFVPTGKGRKEPCFFPKDDYQELWGSYARLFADAPRHALLGEASQCYGGFKRGALARERILALYPEIKLIFIARDPFDRIESSFREAHHSVGRGLKFPFDLRKAFDRQPPTMLEDTRYFTRIQNYRRHVRRDQILVVLLEELAADPRRVLSRCFEFLGVDPDVPLAAPDLRLNVGSAKLYDTQRLRWLRLNKRNPDTAACFAALDHKRLDPILEKTGLRKRFSGAPMRWPPGAEEHAIATVGDDVLEFLDAFELDVAVWPRFAAAMSRREERRAQRSGTADPAVTGIESADSRSNNRIVAAGGATAGRPRVAFCGHDNTVELGRGVLYDADCAIRIVGDGNTLLVGDDVRLRGRSLLCIDGNDNHVRVASRSDGEVVVFIETNGGRFEIGGTTSFTSGTPLVISETSAFDWRLAGSSFEPSGER
jgi:Sulfotransferase domain